MPKRTKNVYLLLVNIPTNLMLFLDKSVATGRGQHNNNMPAYRSSFFLKKGKNSPLNCIFPHLLTLYPFRRYYHTKIKTPGEHMHQNTGTLEAPNFCTNHEERQCSLLFRATSNCISNNCASNSTVICCDTSCTC